MTEKKDYEQATMPLPEEYLAWPLFGAGLDKLGKNGKPVTRPMPTFSEDELLARINAVSLCYTDLKQIRMGNEHPRLLGRDLSSNPIVPGHEVSLTIVHVGRNLHDRYSVGEHYTLQPDVWLDGKSVPFCFGMDGGYRQYTRIGREILDADAGNHLMPVPDSLSYAGSALVEPWACVEATYRIDYRSTPKPEGKMWIVGGKDNRDGYTPGELLSKEHMPSEIIASSIPEDLLEKLQSISSSRNTPIKIKDASDILNSDILFDDVLVLDDAIQNLAGINEHLARKSVVCLLHDSPSNATAVVDIGRIHYDAVQYLGTNGLVLSETYTRTPSRSEFTNGGTALILGSGGPMGRMNLQRSLEVQPGPAVVVAAERNPNRFPVLEPTFQPMAEQASRDLIVINPRGNPEKYEREMERIRDKGGFDDIRLMVVVPEDLPGMLEYAAENCVVDIFAGHKRGTTAAISADKICGPSQVRLIGHSGLKHADEIEVLNKVRAGSLTLERTAAAVGGMLQIPDAIRALENSRFPGKILIFPHVLSFPLTGIPELRETAPEVYAALGEAETWTREAEQIFLDHFGETEG